MTIINRKMRKFLSKLVVFVFFSSFIITMIKKYNHFHQKPYSRMRYILLWTSDETIPFAFLGPGRAGFKRRNCTYTNCIVTNNVSLFGNVTAFDAILFNGPEITGKSLTLPKERSPRQKYVFASIESPANHPLCYHNFNGYFNWTWTYKLDSDIRWGFLAITGPTGTIVGPNKDMDWINWDDMDPVNDTFMYQLTSKHSAVAWFASNCHTASKRENFVKDLRKELNEKYDRDIHVYGKCGDFTCSPAECGAMLSRDYYFLLAFENAFSEDYVTETLLHAVKNNVVPIVYGGANYSRFLPPGSYLDARELKVKGLAEIIDLLISEPFTYAEFFRWKKYYTFYHTTKLKKTNEFCKMCAALNDDKLMKTTSVYYNFDEFWEVNDTCSRMMQYDRRIYI